MSRDAISERVMPLRPSDVRMPMKAASVSLKEKWATFFEVFLSPGVLIVILATAGIVYLAEVAGPGELPGAIRIALTVVVSILSSVVGALVWKRWNDTAELGVLVTRGKSAVRGLNLLLQNIAAAEARVLRLRGGTQGSARPAEHFLMICDEILDRFNSPQEETMNAMEEWTDIIPEANIKTQIGVLTTLKKRATELLELD